MARDRGLSPRIALKLSFLFCFLWAAARGQDLIPNDLQALLAIKQAFSDPNNALQSWNASGGGACQGGWAGVTCAAGEVTILQLAGLGLGGSLSDQVGQLKNLRKFNVHTNNIQGPVPASLWSLPFLRAVYLNKNGFTGEIPSGLGSSSLLQRLDFSSNQLTGSIPEGLAASTRLLYVNVSDNMLSGPVPKDWALNPSVQVVSASRNALSGPVAQRWSSYRLQVLELHGNSLNGSLPLDMGSGTSAMILDLGDNDFSGKLPSELGLLTSLQLLDLSRNQLTGSIPDSFGGLSNLTYLDLSQNNLSGSIPGSLSQLPDLQTFNVSYNELSGSIPMLDQSFPSSSFVGNVGLCGGEVSKVCSGKKKKRLSTLAWVGIAVGIAVCSIALCICFLLLCRGKRRGPGGGGGLMGQAGKRPEESPSSEGDVGGKLVHFDGPLAFSVDDLLRATAEVLGKSSYGTVYKATLEDGTSVAVKRLREGIVKGQREFETEIQGLGAMRHPNLLALRAYYWGPKEEKLLVYDFMPLGSLAALLHGSRGPQTPLGWSTRLKIATGTARGLAFLHAKERIVHGNLTSSNILLDRHMSPQISDYGLSRVMTTSANSTVISTAGALGYRAPELTKLKKATFKSDVYSFGVILLELLTGKAPSDPMTGTNLQSADTTLPDWVTSVVKEEWTNEVFDLDLMKESPPEDELLTTLQLAMNCVAGAPSTRPDIEEVVRHLGDLASTPSPNQQPLHARHDL